MEPGKAEYEQVIAFEPETGLVRARLQILGTGICTFQEFPNGAIHPGVISIPPKQYATAEYGREALRKYCEEHGLVSREVEELEE